MGQRYNEVMRMFTGAGILLFTSLLWSVSGGSAADVFYNDLSETSPSGKYQVTARSPDNRPGGKKGRQPAVQGKFVYVCKDTQSKKILWTLPQPKGSPEKAALPPPLRLSVSDDGWTVIYTGGGEFIPVDVQGSPHGRARLADAINSEEQNSHIHQTTAGPTWLTKSLWSFVSAENAPYFVLRPWWGHRVAVDLTQGKIVEPLPAAVEAASVAHETEQTLRWLKDGADTFKSWEATTGSKQAPLTNDAAYLAGSLHLMEAIPLLRRLEPTIYNSESSLEFLDEAERKQHAGEVNPFTQRTYDLRRMVQLSLRRLGETPLPLPCVVLERAGKGYHDRIVYEPPTLAGPRADSADKVKVGMKTEEVCQLLSVPDYIVGSQWEYDLDSQPPRTLVIQWKNWQVTEVTTVDPARWQDPTQAEDREF